MDTMNIDYVKLAEAIASNTQTPTDQAGWTVFGLIIAILIITNIASWMYFIWRERRNIAREEKHVEVMEKVNETMSKLVVWFDQADINAVHRDLGIIKDRLQNSK